MKFTKEYYIELLNKAADAKGYVGEGEDNLAQAVRNDWNKIVPEAEKVGITHSEMCDIWGLVDWGEYLDEYDDEDDL